MEIGRFIEKTLMLAKSSRQYIERLWKMQLDVSKCGASIVSVFLPIFGTLAKAVMQVLSFSRGIRELFLTKFVFLPPFDLQSRRVTPPREEYFPVEMGRANVSFLFNVNVTRKLALELARRVAVKTPKPALLPEPARLPEPELIEETTEELVEETAKTVPNIAADLQSRFESKLAPSIQHIASAFQEYGRQTILLAPLPEMPKPLPAGPSRFEGPPSLPLVAPPEKEAPQVGLSEKPEAVIPEIPSPPRKEAKVEPSPPISVPVVRLRPEAARAFEYATGLPSVVVEREVPVLGATAAFPLVSPLKRPLPSIEPSYRYPRPTTLSPMRPSQIGRILEEVSPSLTSWIYGVSEILRGTAVSLSAVPIAASTAQRVLMETLIQPVSSLEAPKTLGIQEPVSPGLPPSRPEMGVRHVEVEAFKIPAIVASLIVALSQRYPLLFSEPATSEPWEIPVEPARVAPEETSALGRMAEVKSFSKLPTVIALAAAESLIAQRLHHEFNVLSREMQVARSSYGERLGELGAFGPIRTTMLTKLAKAAPALLPTLEPFVPGVPSVPPPPARVSPVGPTIQNTFNLTISAESAEEDLRDLERKVSRILSEQIRRYYGSTRT